MTGQDIDFENRKAETNLYIGGDALNVAMSQVLSDGSHAVQAVSSESGTVYGQTVKVVKAATEKIYNIGGLVSGALWSGAALLSGTNGE